MYVCVYEYMYVCICVCSALWMLTTLGVVAVVLLLLVVLFFSFLLRIMCIIVAIVSITVISILYQYGWTALMKASSNGHKEVAKLLVDHGADVNIKSNVSIYHPCD